MMLLTSVSVTVHSTRGTLVAQRNGANMCKFILFFVVFLIKIAILNSIPVKIAEIDQNITDFEIVDNTMYAVTQTMISSQLEIYDLTNPSNPELIGLYENTYWGILETPCIAIEEETAFLINQKSNLNHYPEETELLILNISNPDNIEMISTQSIPISAFSIEIEDNLAYVISTWNLHIYDISNLQQIIQINTIAIDNIYNIFIENELCFASCRESGLRIYSLEIPTDPELLSVFNNVYDVYYTYYEDDLAYVCNSENGVMIFDVSDPTDPEYISQCGSCEYSRHCFTSDNLLMITDYYHGLEIYDISDIYNPLFVTAYNPADTSIKCILVENCAITGGSKGNIIDISNLSNPDYVTHFDIAQTDFHNAIFQDQFAHTYISNYSQFHNHRIQIIDYSNVFEPILLGEYPTYHNSNGYAVSGNYAYTFTVGGFNIFDITNSNNPDLLSTTSSCGNNDLAINEEIAFTIDNITIFVLDISNPQNPTIVSNYELGWAHQERIYCHNDYLYVLDPLQGIAIYSLQPDLTLQYVSYVFLTQIETIQFRDSFLLASTENSLNIIDISDVSTPSLINSITISDYQTYLINNNLFVFDKNWNQLHVYDITDISNPQWLGYLNYNYQISDVLPYQDFITIVTKNQGIFIYDDLWNLVHEDTHEIQFSSESYFIANHPNPFNPTTIIDFSLPYDSKVELTIYNVKGQKNVTLANNQFSKGTHSIIWNGDNEFGNPVSSGVYFYKLNVNGKTEAVKKCLLLK